MTSDPVDSTQIILSKNHGFVQVFDLYNFPYHHPDSGYVRGLDYYLDALGYITGSAPTKANIVFTLTDIYNPTRIQMNNWSAGDVYEHKAYNPGLICSLAYPQSFIWYFDSVVAVATFSDHVEYSCVGWLATQDCWLSTTGIALYDTVSTSRTFAFYNDHPVFDTTLMPEEFKQHYFMEYHPGDTSYCMTGTLWRLAGTMLHGGALYPTFWENNAPWIDYKMGLGLAKYTLESPPGLYRGDTELLYYNRSGISCGTYIFPPVVTGVDDVHMASTQFSVLPNPARGSLTVTSEQAGSYTITIINVMGQAVKTMDCAGATETTMDLSNLPAGMYNLHIVTGYGEQVNRKVVVVH